MLENSVIENLKERKEVMNKKEFAVAITETLRMPVMVTANDMSEAEQIVSDKWDDGQYILDADCFIGAEFEVQTPVEQRVQKPKSNDMEH